MIYGDLVPTWELGFRQCLLVFFLRLISIASTDAITITICIIIIIIIVIGTVMSKKFRVAVTSAVAIAITPAMYLS